MQSAFVFMGGTFDPIHNGHLRTALEIKQWLDVPQVHLIPAKQPVHKDKLDTKTAERLVMLDLATADESGLVVDSRELDSEQPSYSLLTLQQLRAELGTEQPICMILGMDAYLGLPHWYQWRELLQYTNILVLARPGYACQPDSDLQASTWQNKVQTAEQLLSQPAGALCIYEMTLLDIAATQIRKLVNAQQSVRYLVPDAVCNYIQTKNLYGYKPK